jgi:hypothetical protein
MWFVSKLTGLLTATRTKCISSAKVPCRFSSLKRGALSSRLDFKLTDRYQRVYGIVKALMVRRNSKSVRGFQIF